MSNAIGDLVEENYKLREEIEDLKEETEKLTKEWLKSQEKRRKAIEYIENNFISYEDATRDLRLNVSYELEIGTDEIGELLEILQGSDKE